MSVDRTSRHAAEERVQQFMVEFEAQWQTAAPVFERDDDSAFELWGELMEQTMRNHFTESSDVHLAQSFSSPAKHGIEAERIVRSEMHGDIAYVLTQRTSSLKNFFYEYTVCAQGPDWKISAIATHFGDPTEPFVSRSTVDEYLLPCAADAPFAEMPEDEAQLDQTHNFTDREATDEEDGEITQAQVSGIGTLVTSTGVLSVLDFGYENGDARPLARTVAPGAYPVDRVTGFGRNAAVRVRFNEETPVSWHPASLAERDHVVGVDAGCVCIVDYVAYSTMTRRDKAAEFERFTAVSQPAVLEIPLGGNDVGLAVESGFGDGGYPAYWGVDAHGNTAQLVVDFMVLVAEDDDGVVTHL